MRGKKGSVGMELYNFMEMPDNNKTYGGNAGLKKGIVWNDENWLLKFPKNTLIYKIEGVVSYTTNALSEYIGSKIYESIGIKTHKTQLGIYGNKVVVACKDFLSEKEILKEYSSIKNIYVDGLEERLIHTSQSSSLIDLDEIIIVMNENPVFKHVPELKEHFWNMFIVDALIGNNDRNNGNWGIIQNVETNDMEIAPVYDNGNAFYNKATSQKIKNILSDDYKFIQSVYESRICIFSQNDKTINPLKFIERAENSECSEALLRIVPNINLVRIKEIIDEIPTEYKGVEIINNYQREFYYKAVEYIYNKVLIPTYEQIVTWKNLQSQNR